MPIVACSKATAKCDRVTTMELFTVLYLMYLRSSFSSSIIAFVKLVNMTIDVLYFFISFLTLCKNYFSSVTLVLTPSACFINIKLEL